MNLHCSLIQLPALTHSTEWTRDTVEWEVYFAVSETFTTEAMKLIMQMRKRRRGGGRRR